MKVQNFPFSLFYSMHALLHLATKSPISIAFFGLMIHVNNIYFVFYHFFLPVLCLHLLSSFIQDSSSSIHLPSVPASWA